MIQKENFRNFLKQHKAYDRFCRNLLQQHGRSFDEVMRNRINFRGVIDGYLRWAETNEGRNFWSNLSSAWHKELDLGKQYKPEYKSIW